VFGISTDRQFDGTSVKQPVQNDWLASFVEHNGDFTNHKATGFDTQSVTVQYFQGGSTMTAYLVPGSPYMTFKYNAATPLFESKNGGIQSFNGKDLAVGESCKSFSAWRLQEKVLTIGSVCDWNNFYRCRYVWNNVSHLFIQIDYTYSRA
jgi:hypothetical protein